MTRFVDSNINPYLRLQSLFGGEGVDPQVTELGGQAVFTNPNNPWEVTNELTKGQGGNEFNTPFDVDARFNELYRPETAASENFSRIQADMPQRERPGILQSIAAALSAFGPGGHQTGQNVLHGDYNRKFADWKAQMEPAYQSANLERYANANARTLASQQVASELRARKDAETATTNERKAQTSAFRAAVTAIKVMGGDWKTVKTKGGNVWLYNSKSGEFKDSGVPTGMMTDEDTMELKLNNKLIELDLRADNAQDLATIKSMLDAQRQKDVLTHEQGLGSDRFTRESGEDNKPLSPPQTTTDRWNRVLGLRANYPALGKYIVDKPGRGYAVDPKTPPAERKIIMDYVEKGVLPDDSGMGEIKIPSSQSSMEQYKTLPEKPGLFGTLSGWQKQATDAIGSMGRSAAEGIVGKPPMEPVPPPVPEGEVDTGGPKVWTVNPKTGKIAVRKKSTNQTGWVDRSELISGLYEPITPPRGSF